MKYLFALLFGVVVGAVLLVVGLAYNPFVNKQGLSPLSVTTEETLVLSYSAVAADSIVFTNNGEARVASHPRKVLQLWEAPIRKTSAMTTTLRNARNEVTGFGIKFSSLSEKTRVLEGEAIVDSVWYLHLPDKGSFVFEQSENHWGFLREVVVPAYTSSGKTWKGNWLGDITAGPGPLRTANVSGVSGEFDGVEMRGVESLSSRVWSAKRGHVSAVGRLTIELPGDAAPEVDSEDDEL